MKLRVLVLGAGFGGLELSTILSNTIGDRLELTLIDKRDSFYLGASKLDVMIGRKSPEAVKIPYHKLSKPGVQFRQETIRTIDPENVQVTTDRGSYQADVMVVALGADYDLGFTPGLIEQGHEFYTLGGAERLRDHLPTFQGGDVVVGVADLPFKCPTAPSEAVLLLHDYFKERGIRDKTNISLVVPLDKPIPPSAETSDALLAAFAERDIRFFPEMLVNSYDHDQKSVTLLDESQQPCDLFIGIPKHRAPKVVLESGLCENGWVPVDTATLQTKFPGVYAVGDVTSVGVPRAGVFAEGAARVVAQTIISEFSDTEKPAAYDGIGVCYIEFGNKQVAKVKVDFLSGPERTGVFTRPEHSLVKEKIEFAATRYARWFDLT